ncbi:UDP-glucuronosyltransferase [Aphelenchoides besseyi]|nr:UDP-glucuronosyltransferase [Aphelenchoides besseyi]
MQMTAFTSYVLMLQYLNLVAEVTAFNVLIVSGTDTGSHQASLSAMFTRFAQAGHHVYLFDSSNPKPVEYGYSNIHTLSAYIQPNLTERAEKIAKFWRLPFRSISPSGMQIWGDELLGRFIDDHSEVLTAIMKLKIDLIVIDEIKVHPSAIAEQFHELHGVPFIDFWTTEPYNHIFVIIAFIVLSIGVSESARILCIPAQDSGSHLISYMRVVERLAACGHQVDLMDFSNTTQSSTLPQNITKLDLYSVKQPTTNSTANVAGPKRRWIETFTAHLFMSNYQESDEDFGQLIADHPKTLNEVLNIQYDLIIADPIFSPNAFSLSMRLKNERDVPYLFYSPSGEVTVAVTEPMSLGRNPVIKSFMFPSPPRSSNDYYQATIFRYRLASFVDTLYEIVGFHWLVTMPNIARFGVVDFSWHKLFKDASVTFSDSLERLGWPVAEGTDLINTGAYCKLSEVLTGELKEFVEDPKSNGTIYVAFGTYADWSYAPKHILTAFANGLQHFSEYRVIFSFNGDLSIMPKVSFIKFVKWAPQAAILNHPRTKVFISHGGLKSLKESICSRTPIIIMPLFAEQAHNAHMFLALKLGRTLNKFTVDEYDVQYEVNKILQNPYYQQKIEKTREIMLDRPKDALDMALFYAERIVRTRAPNNRIVFQRKGMDLYWFEYLYSEFVLLLNTKKLLDCLSLDV